MAVRDPDSQDFWRMIPPLLGTERTGLDRSNVVARQPSDTWNYIHLYNPRAVVKASVMQAYPWFFVIKDTPGTGGVVVPVSPEFAPRRGKVVATQAAMDLVAYLLSLNRLRGAPIIPRDFFPSLTPSNPVGPRRV